MTSIHEQDKKKGGRPPTGRVRKLSKSVTVKFSKPSYEALRLRARKANRKLAEYIRESALNGEVVSGHNTETVAIAKNLIGMANNLNQLTKLSHQRGFHETHVYVVDLLFFNDTATTEIYTLSLHDALPISYRNKTRERAEDRLQAGFASCRSLSR